MVWYSWNITMVSSSHHMQFSTMHSAILVLYIYIYTSLINFLLDIHSLAKRWHLSLLQLLFFFSYTSPFAIFHLLFINTNIIKNSTLLSINPKKNPNFASKTDTFSFSTPSQAPGPTTPQTQILEQKTSLSWSQIQQQTKWKTKLWF